jgi:hypothetical protein
MNCMRIDLKKKFGLKTKEIEKGNLVEIDKENGVINFFPAKSKGENYIIHISYFNSSLSKEEIINTVKEYTNHVTWYCSKVNLLLAADSPEISKHSVFIGKLDWSIRRLANIHPVKEVKCFRGLSCSKKEIDQYKVGSIIFIPSFMSTSRNVNKMYTSDKQNTVFVIHLSKIPSCAFSVNSEYSEYADTEEEALFSCYSRFRVLFLEEKKEFNGKQYDYYLELELVEEFESTLKFQFLNWLHNN